MKQNFLHKVLIASAFLTVPVAVAHAQTPAKWTVTGNTAASTDWLGTINNEDLVFKTNSAVAFKIKANGNIIVKSLDSSGNGLVTVDNNGKLIQMPFTGSATDVLLGNGTFGAAPSGFWNAGTGNKIYYNAGKVGIGTSTPNFLLDVNGDVRIANNLYLQGGLIISDKIQTPKQMKAGSIVVDSLLMDSTRAVYGVANFVNDVKLQSKLNVNGNTTINGSLTANTISTPNLSTTNFSVSALLAANKISAYRILAQPGDTLIRFGDSSIYLDPYHNRISAASITYAGTTYGGFGLGLATTARGIRSLAIGTGTKTGPSATQAIVIGASALMVNTIPNSLMIGFNSDIPTIFVSNSAGAGTTGSVAIGDTHIPSGYKLAVNGKIICEEVKVKLRADWPDYVFSNNYNLLPLNELEEFIKTNKHLPEISSAEEIKKDGINTSEMITNLLKKQEELTLYIIEQNKRIEALERQAQNK